MDNMKMYDLKRKCNKKLFECFCVNTFDVLINTKVLK